MEFPSCWISVAQMSKDRILLSHDPTDFQKDESWNDTADGMLI